MGKKATKATRKFAASGQLKKTIQQRRKHQDIKRKAERRRTGKKGKETQDTREGDADEENDVELEGAESKCVFSSSSCVDVLTRFRFKGMSVDDFRGGGFLEGQEEDEVCEHQYIWRRAHTVTTGHGRRPAEQRRG